MATTVRPAIFFRIDTAEPVRIWTGSHPRRLPADDVEDDPTAEYLGLGLSELPAIDVLLNGDAGEYEFVISGLEPSMLAYIDEPGDISGALVHLGELKFNAAWQPTGGVDWFGSFEADTINYRTSGDDNGQRFATVGLQVSSATTDRRLPRNQHWSAIENPDPTDKAYEHVNRYAAGSRRQYPA